MKVSAITIRPGNVLEYNEKLWVVLKNDIIQPGKGAAVVQVEMRDLSSGNKTNVRFRTQETVERARVDEVEYQFLFETDGEYAFMNVENYEQLTISSDLIGDPKVFLQDGMIVQVQIYDGRPLAVTGMLTALATASVSSTTRSKSWPISRSSSSIHPLMLPSSTGRCSTNTRSPANSVRVCSSTTLRSLSVWAVA